MTPTAADQKREVKTLEAWTSKIAAQRAVLDEMIADRDREVVRACDYYDMGADEVGRALGISTQRVNQIIAERAK